MSATDQGYDVETRTATTMLLRERIQGTVLLPEDEGFAAGHFAFNTAVTHAPAVVVLPECSQDIAEAVRFADVNDLPVGVQATGHGARWSCAGGVLINTSRMTGVTIDPERRTARVEAGARWGAVTEAAAAHGLAALNGSSPTVGVVGYTLGGGTGWLARQYGFAADKITRAELVTARGRQIFVSPDEHADLFRALRGGGGHFGIVTALEFSLVSVAEVFAGMTVYPLAQAPAVLAAYAGWSATMPESVTSSVAIMRFPPMPMIPEPLRGQQVIIVRACHTGDLAEGERLIAPARAFGTPLIDTFGILPWSQNATISSDPVDPLPHTATTMLLPDLSAGTIAGLLAGAGPDVETALLMVEVRHIAGAARHADPATAVANRIDAPYVLYAIAIIPVPELAPVAAASHIRLVEALRPFATAGAFPNFISYGADTGAETYRSAFTPETWEYLVAVKGCYDPDNRFRHNGTLAPA